MLKECDLIIPSTIRICRTVEESCALYLEFVKINKKHPSSSSSDPEEKKLYFFRRYNKNHPLVIEMLEQLKKEGY